MSQRIPDCHPDRPYQANGLCMKCYMQEYDKKRYEQRHQKKDPSEYAENFRKPPRTPARVNECGHPDRPHYGHGMCASCWQMDWKKRDKGTARCHPDRPAFIKGLCEQCYRAEKYWDDPEKSREVASAYHRSAAARLRAELLAAYGGRCACPRCPETNPAFLTLEHVGRTGKQHRAKVGSHVYADLRRQGWPQEGYTLLCWNCNALTRFGKACPHMEDAD